MALSFGCAFEAIRVLLPYVSSSAIILATLSLGFGLDQYARPKFAVAPDASVERQQP